MLSYQKQLCFVQLCTFPNNPNTVCMSNMKSNTHPVSLVEVRGLTSYSLRDSGGLPPPPPPDDDFPPRPTSSSLFVCWHQDMMWWHTAGLLARQCSTTAFNRRLRLFDDENPSFFETQMNMKLYKFLLIACVCKSDERIKWYSDVKHSAVCTPLSETLVTDSFMDIVYILCVHECVWCKNKHACGQTQRHCMNITGLSCMHAYSVHLWEAV